MNPNNSGIVLCFLIYLALCAMIVSIIEMPWLIVPVGSNVNVNMSDLSMNNTAFTTANLTVSTNLTWTANMPGYCGVSGYCYPFEDESVMISLLTGRWGSRCEQMNPLDVIPAFGDDNTKFVFHVAQHAPFYITLGGSVVLLFTWIVGICSCCNHDCGHCTIYSVVAVMLTFGGTIFATGGALLLMFSRDDRSCIKRLCGEIGSAFDIGHCTPGWSLFVAAGGVLLTYILAVLSCILANKTPLRSKALNNPVVEVRSADYPGRGKMMTSSA